MTYFEIVQRVMDRLNLTSLDAQARIGQEVNDRYRRITTSIGFTPTRFTSVDLACDPAEVGTTLPDVTITDISKVLKVMLLVGTKLKRLHEVTPTEISDREVARADPYKYCVKRMNSQSVTITLNAYPTTTFTLRIEGYQVIINLTDDDEPAMPEDFHDILIFGACADELRKMEKYNEAKDYEVQFESRCSDLRYFIAKSQYLRIYQGKLSQTRPWNQYRLGYWDWNI